MPAINFDPRFAELVARGTKRQTIRRLRKRPIRVGDTLYLYTGQRTKHCRLLRTEQCKEVLPVWIDNGLFFMQVVLGSKRLTLVQTYDLAMDDGFDSPREMREWFGKHYGYVPFDGVLIKW